ncbi:hypothetical protein RB601_003023 [Gaeumannomyces tritici]
MPPAPSTTPPTDVRSSHHEEDTEYLSKASYTAASESCVPPSPSAAAAEVARAATDGRVPDHRRPATRIAEHIPAISEFKALMVDEVNEKDLFHGVGLGRAMGTGHLPLRLVKLPVDDVSKVAVLSWRWDGDLEVRGSKNIAIAVHQAKKMGVRYLFIDLVSIDQCLSGDALMEQVVSFSSLYSTITVIAAYDKDGENRGRTMHRPWISSEVRQFLDSPAKTVRDPLPYPCTRRDLHLMEYQSHELQSVQFRGDWGCERRLFLMDRLPYLPRSDPDRGIAARSYRGNIRPLLLVRRFTTCGACHFRCTWNDRLCLWRVCCTGRNTTRLSQDESTQG